eukprot:m.27841 g.27841  ORF g.27841 m.27841 type:complete len:141 (+) comp30391_c0_seq2:441-863(+)
MEVRDIVEKVNRADDGKGCKNWLNAPSDIASQFVSHDGVGDPSYCRNPLNRDRPWCYTVLRNRKWAYCSSIPPCRDVSIVSFTCNGSGGNRECVLPFTFRGLLFAECTTYNSSVPWRATRVNATGQMTEWGYCLCPRTIL